MGVIEGFTNVMVSDKNEEQKKELYALMIYILLIKLL